MENRGADKNTLAIAILPPLPSMAGIGREGRLNSHRSRGDPDPRFTRHPTQSKARFQNDCTTSTLLVHLQAQREGTSVNSTSVVVAAILIDCHRQIDGQFAATASMASFASPISRCQDERLSPEPLVMLRVSSLTAAA
ncbi:hypothetical protein MUK42_14345 [Musa troglodytarum]|uniref:Uncharacterized protein n=1 Tax=Musa troglodytarum TaxID=320322 RepID=A0A9E7I6W6_9LILI|nr:hypothetical protein MUK42_14345 [Musa troglodytarum]